MRTIFFLSLFFTLFSFTPSFYELWYARQLPEERVFVLEHNYMFDYNFYLSRIKQGMEGQWLVTEKYYSHPHPSSLLHIVYLLAGKVGGTFGVSPPVVYHASRLLLGFTFLFLIGWYTKRLFSGLWRLVAFLFIVTAGSWPVLIRLDNGMWRFATHMGWWSVIDSLQRITTIPHILFGQIFLVLFMWKFSDGLSHRSLRLPRLLMWGMIGMAVGIVFPPTLIIVYIWFAVVSVLEANSVVDWRKWMKTQLLPRFLFAVLTFPALIYLQFAVDELPWSALPLFDIQHRISLQYREYALALGPILPLGIMGLLIALIQRERKYYPAAAWVLSIGLLFFIFEHVPTQSPLRFTEGAIHVPLGILSTYFFYQFYHLGNLSLLGYLRRKLIKTISVTLILFVMIIGLSIMLSMVGWLTDQVRWKAQATWPVPIGAQLVYPLKEFMDGVYFLRDNTKKEDVVLTYVTAGNFIPAYAGNYVYIGHANTPDEDGKEKIAARFFSGVMNEEEARNFLQKERISYVYFGPQERALGSNEMQMTYSFLTEVYKNGQVHIYRVSV